MNYDSFFIQGKTHHVCQDYAIHTDHFFGISDGCSGSPDTDFGSRILLKQIDANNKLGLMPVELYFKEIYDSALNIVNAFNAQKQVLSKSCLDATLNIGCVAPSGKEIAVYVIGDGVIVAKKKDTFEIIDIEYSGNAPEYITYLNDPKRSELFHGLVQNKTVTTNFYTNDLKNCGSNLQTTPISLATKHEHSFVPEKCVVKYFPIGEYKSIHLFSDGIKSLVPNNPNDEKMLLTQIINDVTVFPVTKGDFLKRRFKKYMKNLVDSHFYDDVAIASCIMEEKV